MSLQELRDEAIKAYVEYGQAIKEAFNLQGDLLAAPLIDTLKTGDEGKINEFILDAKRLTAQYKAMVKRVSSNITDGYDYNIIAKPIIPPLGRMYNHAGKVEYIYRYNKNKKIRIDHDFGETWGVTEDEAIQKMEEKVKEWIKSQELS
jgi:hypothetical protein